MEVGGLLAECRAAAERPANLSEEHGLHFCSCRDSLSAELASLLQEALDMKWPFVPEKWQFKQLIGPCDKTNLTDLVREHLPQLLALLKASIMVDEAPTALAVIFLVDRLLYWTDQSSQLLKIARLLHKAHPETPIAPQLVIRQSRVYLNSGTLCGCTYGLIRCLMCTSPRVHLIGQTLEPKHVDYASVLRTNRTTIKRLGVVEFQPDTNRNY